MQSITDSQSEPIRHARGAGRWFPARPQALAADIDRYLDDADVPDIDAPIVAAVAPHAGYMYSGPIAGYTFRSVQQAAAGTPPETVVILGLSHRGGVPGLALMDGRAVATPLGETPLDTDAVERLCAGSRRIRTDYAPHDGEHSAENQVPFVQRVLPEAKLVLGLTGAHDAELVEAAADALAALAEDRRILVVASTDLLHDPDYERVTRTDRETLKRIAALDSEGLLSRWSPDEQVCCGIGPVAIAMQFARRQGCRAGRILAYRNSGDDFPESRGSWVVGYGAVVFAA